MSSENKQDIKLTNELLNVILNGFTVENFGGRAGVIHAHTKSNIKEHPTNNDLILAIKEIELMNDNREPNEQFDIHEILTYFTNSQVLTEKARSLLIDDYFKFVPDEDEFIDWKILVYILKHHAKPYFKEHFNNQFLGKKARFLKSTANFNSVKNITYFDSLQHLINTYSECLAWVDINCYVTKEFDIDSNELILVKYTKEKMLGRLRQIVCIRTTEEERKEMKSKHKEIKEWKEFKLKDLIMHICYLCELPSFHGYKIYTLNKNYLSLYQPPKVTKYNPDLINNWLEFVKSLIEPKYLPALNELFSSISYRLRNPDGGYISFIEKFFIQCGENDDDKCYLIECLGKMFHPFFNCQLKINQIDRIKFDECSTKNLLMWLYDVNDFKKFHHFVYRVTHREISFCKRRELIRAKNIAIVGINTEQTNFNEFLAKGFEVIETIISRLVIIKYREGNKLKYGGEKAFYKKCISFFNDPDFAYSLYYYFMYEYKIPENFHHCRYEGKEKEEFFTKSKQSHIMNSSLNQTITDGIKSFLLDIRFVRKNSNDYEQNEICIEYEEDMNKNNEPVVRFKPIEFMIAYNRWKEENENYRPIRNIYNELINLGFSKCTIKSKNFYVMLKNNFENLLDNIENEFLEIDV